MRIACVLPAAGRLRGNCGAEIGATDLAFLFFPPAFFSSKNNKAA